MARRISLRELVGMGYDGGWFSNLARLGPCRYRLFVGARNSKKSYDIIGVEPVIKLLSDRRRNIIVIRQNLNTIRNSAYAQIQKAIDRMGLTALFKMNESEYRLTYLPTGQEIAFRGFNDPLKITSTTFRYGELTDVYIEEAYEIESEDQFNYLDGSLRGNQGIQLQITFCMNPWNKEHWIYKKFFKGRMEEDEQYLEEHGYREVYDPAFSLGFGKGLYIHQSTYKINEFRSPDYGTDTDELKKYAHEKYCTNFLGMWGSTGDLVYEEWARSKERLIIPRQEAMRMRYDRVAIGIDTGLSNAEGLKRSPDNIRSATVMELVGITSDHSKIVTLDEWFFTNQGLRIPKTQTELIRSMVSTLIYWRTEKWATHPDVLKGRTTLFVDSGSEGFRYDLMLECARQQTEHAFVGTLSTKEKIVSRVDFERLMMGWGDFLVSEDCKNLIREFSVIRNDPETGMRENNNDHAINADEYGWAPLRNLMSRWRRYGMKEGYASSEGRM